MKRQSKKQDRDLSRQIIDVRPLSDRIKGKRLKPGQNPDATEQLFFQEELEYPEDLLPEYVKKMRTERRSSSVSL